MSILSEALENYVKQKKLGIADLAKRCQIDRSTMYQYIHGRRPLQNRELLDAILAELRLRPEERVKVMQAFEITLIGEGRYYRRKKIKEIFESLLTLEEVKGVNLFGGRQEASGSSQDIQNVGSMLISGELKVQKAIRAVVRDACERGVTISLFLQPDIQFFHAMNVVCEYPESCRLIHIICMDADPDPVECGNLEIIKSVIRSGIAIMDYQPFYYYGTPSEHYGMMNMMPYFVITEGCTLQVAIDGKAAIIHKDEGVNQYFQEAFGRMLRQCYPLMKSVIGLMDRITWGIEDLKKPGKYRQNIEMSSGLCSLQFWDRKRIETYLPRSIDGYEHLLEGMVWYMAQLHEAKKKGQVKILMNPGFVLEFIKTGIIKEYPSIYFRTPLAPEDRRYILEQIFQAVEEGWYHLYFLEEREFPLDYRWEAIVEPHENLYMQYCVDNQFRIFEFEIPEVVDAVSDYLESLLQSDSLMDEKSSVELIRRWMEDYL